MFEQLEEPEEKQEAEKEPDYSGMIILAVIAPVFFIFRHFGRTDMGLDACMCLGMNLLAIRFRWSLRRHLWFWIVMALLVGIELLLFSNVRWPEQWIPGVALLPIGIATLLLAFGVVGLTERFVVGHPSGDEEQ